MRRNLALLFLLFAGPAGAVEGILEINQTCALNSGCFPGDSAGFPVTISETGSYALTGNLTVPDEDTTAIELTAERIHLDLRGFTVRGPVSCLGIPPVCSPLGSGIGIDASTAPNATIVNGTVAGMGDLGVTTAVMSRIENLMVEKVGDIGIKAGAGARVAGNRVRLTGGAGIELNVSSIATDNVVTACAGFGPSGVNTSGYGNNVLVSNNGGSANPQVSAGPHEIATNVCENDTVCP